MIKLKHCVGTFGLTGGLSFWFRYNIIDNLNTFIKVKIKKVPWCTNHGYHCREGCEAVKFTKFPDKPLILESDSCYYCGEDPPTTHIFNPNQIMSEKDAVWWKVCEDCKKVIPLQQKYSMLTMLGMEMPTDKIEKDIRDTLNELDNISKESGKPIMMAGISTNTESGKFDVQTKIFKGKKVEDK